METNSEAPTSGEEARSVTHVSPPTLVAIVAACLLPAAVVGFLLGAGRSEVMELRGTAQVGDHMASIEVDGWWYGVSDTVPWIDEDNSHHDGGWPSCLGRAGSNPTVKFGAVPVTPPDSGLTYRAVVFVDCRPD
jgi:hypothetical protein